LAGMTSGTCGSATVRGRRRGNRPAAAVWTGVARWVCWAVARAC
jgi:hypothetical protein